MNRTAQRPIPTGKIAGGSAFVLGWIMCIAALMLIFAQVGRLAALFTLLTIAAYLGWYTPGQEVQPLEHGDRRDRGRLPAADRLVRRRGLRLGARLDPLRRPLLLADPPLHGDRVDLPARLLRVQFPMLPVRDEAGGKVAAWAFAATLALVAVSLLPTLLRPRQPLVRRPRPGPSGACSSGGRRSSCGPPAGTRAPAGSSFSRSPTFPFCSASSWRTAC